MAPVAEADLVLMRRIDELHLEYPWAGSRKLKKHEIQISMDGKGCWRDNVFIERLWRTVKYEEVYLRAYESVSHARESLERYFAIYNGKRPHASLDRRTPDEVYFNR